MPATTDPSLVGSEALPFEAFASYANRTRVGPILRRSPSNAPFEVTPDMEGRAWRRLNDPGSATVDPALVGSRFAETASRFVGDGFPQLLERALRWA